MALPPRLGPTPPSEPFSHPPGAPRELNASGCTICSASGEERIRSEQAQKLGQDSLDPPEPFQGGPRGTDSAAGLPRLPTPPSHEDSAGAKHRERPISGREVLEAEQDSLHLCLLGLGLRLQDLEQGLGPWASAQSRMVQLQALQADLHGAAERLDALLVFGEGLAQRSEPQARASLEQVLRAFRTHRDSIFRQLWRLQAQLVFEEASTLEQDLEVEGDSDGTGPGGVWGPWAPSSLPTPAELEWDPAGDVGGLGPLGQRTTWTPGTPCELCGRRGPQGRGQSLENVNSMDTRTLPVSTLTVSPAPRTVPGHAHVRPQPPETHNRSPKTIPAPEVSGQDEASISQCPGCDAGGRPWSPNSCIQPAPDLPPPPPFPSAGGCHTAPAHVRGLLLLSCPTGQDTLPGAQLCQWSSPSLSTQSRHM
ncbi:nesprin-4 isoform X2 [Balaenoptera musculus]|uniref:Nesprin-4 isoform X2 n=1 Tax=Balaenoptera musculus TaxID=9771 RepID=A0A8B8VVQ5_BALMU|nr:nesprin-4 isoform X2 [Balaenoptera musculus]